MAMNVLYVTGGYTMTGVRSIDLGVVSRPFVVSDEEQGEREYRGQPFVSGTLVVEDAATAIALQTAEPLDVAFAVATGTGVGTITILGFKSSGYSLQIGDGTRSGQVVGYAVSFKGTLDLTDNAGTAATHYRA